MKNSLPIYDKFAPGYDKFFSLLENRFLSNWRAEALSYLPSDSRILEIGAGTGLNFRFYPKCELAVASEISCKMLEFAKEKTSTIKIIQANAERLPFADNSFDAAFATLVLCSVSKPEVVFEELKRVVKPTGKIILLEHVRPKRILGIIFDFLSFFTVRLFDDHFNRQTAKIAAESGLKVSEIRQKVAGIVNLIVCEVIK